MKAQAARRHLFPALLAAMVVLAWISLWAWSRSPWGGYLQHDDWTASGPAAALCRALPGGAVLVPAALYAGAWVVMTAAMMLPTTLPLLDVFARLTVARADRTRLLALVVLGYMAVWGGFGLLAHSVHAGVLWLAGRYPALGWDGWTFGAAVIALAGAFQFSELKRRCLDKCRAPLGFVIEHWRGRAHGRRAFALGAHHGLFCVGCCWALMLLMFAFAAGSVGWMLLLAAVMAVEKNLRWGRHLGAPLGAALLAWAGVLVLQHVGGFDA